MRHHRLPIRIVALLLSVLFLASATSSFAAASLVAESPSPAPAGDEDLPVYMQLMVYVSTLLTEGKEVPKALLNKIEAYYKNGK